MPRKRRSQTTCTCTAYPFPHRDCGGGCAFDDTPAILLAHDRGRGNVGERGKRPECIKRIRHRAAGKHRPKSKLPPRSRRQVRTVVPF